MSNVVVFPKGKKDTPPCTIEEVYENVELARREHIEVLLDDVMPFVFQRCYEEGFDLSSEECIKSTGLFLDVFRSSLYKCAGMEHPLHQAADRYFTVTEESSI